MCGIFGFSRRTKNTTPLIPVLAAAMELRGDDSWGVTDGHVIYKKPHSILATYEDFKLDTPTYHTRGASVGSISERNAHPFEYISHARGITVVGVHNGHISNDDELKNKYHAERKEFQVDSENIFAQIAEGLPTSEVRGWGAVVWYEYPNGKPKERRRFISTFNNANMHIVKLKSGEVVFASTIESIRIAARFADVELAGIVKLVDKMKYEIMPNGDIRTHGLMEWDHKPPFVRAALSDITRAPGRRSYPAVNSHAGYPSYPAGRGITDETSTCKELKCYNPTDEDEVLCQKCIRSLLSEYFDEWNEAADALAKAVTEASTADPLASVQKRADELEQADIVARATGGRRIDMSGAKIVSAVIARREAGNPIIAHVLMQDHNDIMSRNDSSGTHHLPKAEPYVTLGPGLPSSRQRTFGTGD